MKRLLTWKCLPQNGDIHQALNNYLTAIELNPDSPAQTAYNAQIKILDFITKICSIIERLFPSLLPDNLTQVLQQSDIHVAYLTVTCREGSSE